MDYKKVSIVVPVYNEKNTLEEIISRIEKAPIFDMEKEIVIVDDFSSDGSRDILEKIRKKHQVVYHEKNRGKGAALRTGFNNVSGDVVIIQDADLEYNPQEYHELIKPILDGAADVVYGSRFMGGRPHRVLYYWHYVGNKLLTTFSNMLTNLNLSDMETCYKVFSRQTLESIKPHLQSDRFGFEPEVTAKIGKLTKKNSCRVYEIGISYSGRTYEEGKKIGWRDGMEAIWCIIKYNLF